MGAYKVYKSGNSYEIYHYEKVLSSRFEEEVTTNERILEKVENEDNGILKHNFLTKEQLKDKRRLQTMRENRMHMMRMAKEYFSTGALFLTLTYSENVTAEKIDDSEEHIKYFFKKLRRDYGDVSFLGVRELQKRGAIHYHFLIKNVDLELIYKDIPVAKKRGRKRVSSEQQKEFEQYLHLRYWPHGWVTLFHLVDCDNVGAYLTKYMTKGDVKSMEWLEGRKMYLKSRDIKKVEALDANEYSHLIKSIVDLIPYYKSIAEEDIYFNNERKRVFTNSYNSEFNGLVEYYDINLDRITELN